LNLDQLLKNKHGARFIISPLKVTAHYVDKIAKGDIPQKITETYNGDFNTIKNNLNILVDSNNEIIEKTKQLAKGDCWLN